MCAGDGSRKEGEARGRLEGSIPKVVDGKSVCSCGEVGGKEEAKGVIVLLDLKQVKRK